MRGDILRQTNAIEFDSKKVVLFSKEMSAIVKSSININVASDCLNTHTHICHQHYFLINFI